MSQNIENSTIASPSKNTTSATSLDPESQAFLNKMGEAEKVRAQRVAGVRTILVVLSSKGMVYDVEALRQKILLSYPEAAVFFRTTLGKPVGADSPEKVDLLVDFTGPGQRQGLFYSRKLRGMSKVAVGRNAGLFRAKIYDRVVDEKSMSGLASDVLTRERQVQKLVLERAGIPLVQAGDTPPDRGKITPLGLPPLAKA